MVRSGGCFCGALRYEVHGDVFNVTTCHCRSCRRIAGAPALSWFTVKRDGLRWLAGNPAILRSSPGVTRTFCAACGTPLGYRRDDTPEECDVTLCSLDAPETLAPTDHTFTGEALPWNIVCDGLPRYRRTRAEG
ncbi:GFA family protein [Massilia sp. DWR3-1-1]|uniref:GFA family protein n=1 Tax=Massilia sp. DWR3-1-1 TaxID=2804559 RepID=UPI003CF70C8B